MSRFGWAYVNDVITGSGATPGGSDKAIQFASGSTFSGSTNFTFDYTSNTVRLTGTLYADNLIVSSSQILKSGSTIFGDDISDTHQFTGSILGGAVSGTTAQFTTITSQGATITGSLLMSGAAYISEVDYIDFDVSASIPTYKAARIFHDTNTNDLSYYLPLASQALQIGQQTVVKVKNSSGSPIAKGKLVHITGGVGDNPLINTASWDNDNNSANTLGMLMSTVAHNGFGYALLNGVLTGVNTNPATYSEGQVIYLSSSGDYTNVVPTAPNHTVRLGQVVRAHATVGSVFIKIDNGYELDELHNILITSASTGDLLTYNSSSALWTNTKSLTGSYTITGSLTVSGSSTFTNIGPAIFSGTVNANDVISGTSAQFTDLTASVGRITTVIASTVTGSIARFTTISGSTISGSSFVNVATGAATQVQYNAGLGLLGADSNFTYSSATKALTVNGSITTTTSSFNRLEGQVTGSLTVNSIAEWNNIAGQFLSSNIYKISAGNQAVISASNGLAVTGNVGVDGQLSATSFSGNGSGLTNINASFPLYTTKTFQAYFEPNGANINMYPAHVNGAGSLLTPLRTNTGGGSIQGNGASSIIDGVSYGDFKTGNTADTNDGGTTFLYWNTGASSNFLTGSNNPTLRMRLRTDTNISDMGIYAGFRIGQSSAYTTTTVFLNSTGSEHLAALWYVTSSASPTTSSNGNWQLIVRSGSTETRVNTGVTVATNTVYDITITWTTSSVSATVNNTTVSSSTNLPIGFSAPAIAVSTLTSSVKTVYFGGYSVSYT